MKSLEELKAIRDRMKSSVTLREEQGDNIRVVVGMATCGIGICQYEPVVEVYEADGKKTTYIKMTADKVAKVVTDHLVNGNVVKEYTIGNL